jgi:hypothetical protein
MTGDVLDANETGSKLSNEPLDVGPEVSFVVVLHPLSGSRPRLARDAANDAIHDSSPRACVKGSEVTPDRSRIQVPFFHAADQYRGCISFPLDVTDRASAEACSSKSIMEAEVEPSDARADGETVDGR